MSRARAHPLHPHRAIGRLVLGLALGLGTSLALPSRLGWAVRVTAGWDAGALALLAVVWTIILRATPHETRQRASSEDPGHTAVWAIVLGSSAFSLFCATAALREAQHLAPAWSKLLVVLCLVAVASAWALTHASYAFRYAHLYYRDDSAASGIEFPGKQAPDDFDFAYVAYTIGMCFQVSDVLLCGRPVRRTALLQAITSFAYNTTILALVLNLIFDLAR